MFKSLPIADCIYRRNSLPGSATSYRNDTITLGWEERSRGRGRRRSDGGIEFGTALERGTMLRAGDCFVLDRLSLVVEVIERDEPVFIIEPSSPGQWALCGYWIGNSHQPVMITATAIVCADTPGMDQVLEQHRIAFVRATRPFTPVGLGSDHDIAGHRHG